MASERQIAANRRNARKSTGPRTAAGKTRAKKNAYRHGLAAAPVWGIRLGQIDRRARRIAGRGSSTTALSFARTVAETELEIARVRETKIAVIELVRRFGYDPDPGALPSQMIPAVDALPRRSAEAQLLRTFVRTINKVSRPQIMSMNNPMPRSDPERLAEAMQRSAKELIKTRPL